MSSLRSTIVTPSPQRQHAADTSAGRMPLRAIHYLLLAAIVALSATAPALASSARKRVAEGNRAYAEGNYADALAAYDEAEVDLPESPRIYFNRGLAFYRQEEFNKAVDAFEKASLNAKEMWLQSRSRFNLGNCAFREAERQKDSDIRKSLAAYERSIRHYQDALDLDPEFKEAAENVEIVRLIMKVLMDELKKQEEAARQQQKKQQQAAEKLKELIDRQQDALEKNKALSDRQEKQGESEAGAEESKDLASQQRQLANDTEELADEMESQQQQAPQPGPSPADQAGEHLDRAVTEQNRAADRLDDNQESKARSNQEKAVEDLKKALDALSGQQQGGQGEQQQEEEGGQQQEHQGEEEGQQDSPPEGEEQPLPEESVVPLTDEAHDILDEEDENRERRRLPAGGYRPVDRDW